jgi:hypothetical protein
MRCQTKVTVAERPKQASGSGGRFSECPQQYGKPLVFVHGVDPRSDIRRVHRNSPFGVRRNGRGVPGAASATTPA